MKIKKMPLIMALCAVAAVAGGCEKIPDNVTNEYDALNAMLTHNYSQIVLTVTNEFSEESVLTSEYTMKFSDTGMTVTYSIERFSEVSLDFTAPATTKLEGEAVIADGKVNHIKGDNANLDAVTAGDGFYFKEEYFSDIVFTEVTMQANVNDPSGFMGSEINCTEMKLKAKFIEVFYNIEITYTAQSGNHLTYNYKFSK